VTALQLADLIVVGVGPAGASAALAASSCGLAVICLDEAPAAGGQVWRAPWSGLDAKRHGPDAVAGDALRARLSGSTVAALFGRRVWSVTERFRVDALGPDGNEAFVAPQLVAATGAFERVVPFPGWTLPGVVGLAAATVLLKAHAVLPGRRVLVAGCGPLLAAVAAGILKGGGEVVAVVDRSARSEWLRFLPRLASRPSLMRQGLGWTLKVAGARVPILFGHAVVGAVGEGAVEEAVVAPVDADRRSPAPLRRFAIDALCVGDGLVPGGEIPRLLRAEHCFDRRRGGWIPVLDEDGRASVAGLYAAGDGAGLRGAEPAAHSGAVAGYAAALDAGRLTPDAFAAHTSPHRRALRALHPFADAVADLMHLRPSHARLIPPETVVCRCEDMTRAEIDAAVEAGAADVNQLKHFTRCGMGPCQGRMCGDVVAELVGGRVGGREAAGFWTGRPPLRPVPLADLVGTFTYADIPIPEPAPL
jgi:thioredoxin reductase/bacterioferritin-associated ferredoxin